MTRYECLTVAYYAVSLVVQLVVGVVIWWYTKETQKIRKQGEKQLDLITREQQRAVAPYIAGRFLFPERNSQGYWCIILNPSDRLANDVNVLALVGTEYFWSDSGFDVVGKTSDESGPQLLASGPHDSGLAFSKIREAYPDWPGLFVEALANRPGSLLAVFYRDVEGRLYMSLRSVIMHEGKPSNLDTVRIVHPT